MTYSRFQSSVSVIDGLAMLVVEEDHPFFYDHPLDHVPGMLLLTGLLDSLDPDDRGVRLAVRFTSWCEPGRVNLSVTPDPDGGWLLGATQNGIQVCAGTVQYRDGGHFDLPPARHPDIAPVSAELVHRADPANVLLRKPLVGDLVTAALMTPPDGHFLRRNGESYAIEEVVEAARQLMTFGWHTVYGQPMDTQLIWLGAAVDVVALPSRDVPLTLQWEPAPAQGRKPWFDMGLFAGEQRLGSLNLQSMAVAPAAYERLRQR